jgi:hypothetical protein
MQNTNEKDTKDKDSKPAGGKVDKEALALSIEEKNKAVKTNQIVKK